MSTIPPWFPLLASWMHKGTSFQPPVKDSGICDIFCIRRFFSRHFFGRFCSRFSTTLLSRTKCGPVGLILRSGHQAAAAANVQTRPAPERTSQAKLWWGWQVGGDQEEENHHLHRSSQPNATRSHHSHLKHIWHSIRMSLGTRPVKIKVVKWCRKKWNEHYLMYIYHKQCEIKQTNQ